tara:strand:- start:28 stop:429 length:402 start_codon:yes stop_codon:yes gene_type:complete
LSEPSNESDLEEEHKNDSEDASGSIEESAGNRLFGSAQGWELVFKIAGALGIDPNPYSLKELFWLYEGRDRQQWMHTASITATLSASAGAKNCSIEKYHPYLAGQRAKEQKSKLLAIKAKRDAAKNGKNTSKD